MTKRSFTGADRAKPAASAAVAGAAANADRMTDAQFVRISAIVGELSGIVIKDHKREMVHSRLARRLRALGLANFGAYLDLLETDAGREEVGELINAVTTNLTAFFREAHHFDHLKSAILDPMAAARQDRIRIWSSACSSGEEPYSIAMTVKASRAASARDLKILATDLDTNILARASRGVYPRDRIATIPAGFGRGAYDEQADGSGAFTPSIKSLITFRQLNLLHRWPVSGPFDAIFCRNVLIYFENDVKREIVDRLVKLLRPEGALYLGHSESLLGDHPLLESEGRTIYRRRG